jgi:two-component system, NarL family, nitrate/nitrite response regulator NarL
MRQTGKATIVIASAVAESRARWRSGLEETFDVSEVVERRTLEKAAASLKPDVLVIDLALPQLGRVHGLPQIRQSSPSTKILVLTDAPAESEGMLVLKAGAKGYYPRVIEAALLKKAAEAIAKGEIWIQRKFVASLVAEVISLTESRETEADAEPAPYLEGLTLRQRMVAAMISQGACNKEIASHLKITERTVKAHLTETFRSLGISDRLQLALLLMKGPSLSGHSLAQPNSKSA